MARRIPVPSSAGRDALASLWRATRIPGWPPAMASAAFVLAYLAASLVGIAALAALGRLAGAG